MVTPLVLLAGAAGALAAHDVARLTQAIRGTGSWARFDQAFKQAPKVNTRLHVLKSAPLEVLLPAQAAHAIGRVPLSVATSRAQLERVFRRHSSLPQRAWGDAVDHLSGSPAYTTLTGNRHTGGLHIVVGGDRRLPVAAVEHEFGHLNDAWLGGPNRAMLDALSKREPRWKRWADVALGRLHPGGLVAQERAAWSRVPAELMDEELRDAALATYRDHLSSSRAPASLALAAGLAGAATIEAVRRPDLEKAAMDPLTAGTAAVMLPAAILHALGKGGLAGSMSRNAAWRRPVLAATDAAVNRAAAGAGELAMATAGLNWALRKAMSGISPDPTPSMEEQQAAQLALADGFAEELDELDDGMMERTAGLLGKALGRSVTGQGANTLADVARPLLAPGAKITLPAGLDAARAIESNPHLKSKALELFGRFKSSPEMRAKYPKLDRLASDLPDDPSTLGRLARLQLGGKILADPGVINEGKAFVRAEVPGLKTASVKLAEPPPPKGWSSSDWDYYLQHGRRPGEKTAATKVSPPPDRNRKEHPYVGTVQFADLPLILVENKKGSTRSGTGPGGVKWETVMPAHYGEFRGTAGTDGDPVDVYVGPNDKSTNVYIVHTKKPPTFRVFDEDKVFIGFDSLADVKAAMKAAYDDERFLGGVSACSLADLKKLLSARTTRGRKLDQALVLEKAAAALWHGFEREVQALGAPLSAPRQMLGLVL